MAKALIEVGTASAQPGQKSTGHIRAGEMSDGSPIDIPVIILNGALDGPTLWVHALEDGNEYPGCMAIIELSLALGNSLDKLSGAIVMIPAVNVTAFRGNPWGGGIRNSPADLDGGIAFPRQYPGNPDGGFSAQAAASIWTPLTKYANYFITCHGSGEMFGIDRVLLFKSEAPAYAQAVELAKALGVQVILTAGGGDPKRPKSFIEQLIEKGVPAISVESNGGPGGVGLGWGSSAIKEAMLNGMKHLKMIEGEPSTSPAHIFVHYDKGSGGIFPHRGGFFRSLVKVMDKVDEGEDIGVIYNFFGEELEKVRSPVNGVVLGYWGKCPQIGSGQYRVFEIGIPNE